MNYPHKHGMTPDGAAFYKKYPGTDNVVPGRIFKDIEIFQRMAAEGLAPTILGSEVVEDGTVIFLEPIDGYNLLQIPPDNPELKYRVIPQQAASLCIALQKLGIYQRDFSAVNVMYDQKNNRCVNVDFDDTYAIPTTERQSIMLYSRLMLDCFCGIDLIGLVDDANEDNDEIRRLIMSPERYQEYLNRSIEIEKQYGIQYSNSYIGEFAYADEIIRHKLREIEVIKHIQPQLLNFLIRGVNAEIMDVDFSEIYRSIE